MNTRYYMVIIKGEIKTSEIMSCGYNRNNQKWDVKFNNGKTYSYAYLNVEKLTDPEVLNPNMYPELLNEQECQYAMNSATHLDFLIYNRIGKKPVLAIEVDGYEYHKEDTVQASRDLLKNHIMELYEIPLRI